MKFIFTLFMCVGCFLVGRASSSMSFKEMSTAYFKIKGTAGNVIDQKLNGCISQNKPEKDVTLSDAACEFHQSLKKGISKILADNLQASN